MTDKLLPCPFCGGKAELCTYKPAGMSWVRCTKCGASNDASLSANETVAAWNARAAYETDRYFFLPKPNQDIGFTTPPRVTSVTSKYGSYTVEAEQFIELNNRLTREWTRKVGDDIIRRICKVWLGDELTERTCECGWHGFVDGWGYDPPNYCPNCGAKVVR